MPYQMAYSTLHSLEYVDIYLSTESSGLTPGEREQLPLIKARPEGVRFRKEIPLDPKSLDTIHFYTSQLNNCLNNHPKCRQAVYEKKSTADATLAPELPSRLLHIRPNGAAKLIAYLVDTGGSATASAPPPPQYAALSYCWGDTTTRPAFKTTADNVAQYYRTGFDVAVAPATLRDAVAVCQHLGLAHLWVDALCIIQGDESDWTRESRKMGRVYANAVVTIVAASAESRHDGFLVTTKGREPSIPAARTVVPTRPDDGGNGSCEVLVRIRRRMQCGHHVLLGDNLVRQSVDPIDARAWTLQERALSTRALVFAYGEVQWECLTKKACECGGPSEETVRQLWDGTYDEMARWDSLVEAYTRRKLTVNKDRLPALSALARRMAPSFAPTAAYMAGLWISRRPEEKAGYHSLCWSVVHNAGLVSSCFSSGYLAPSFSWASVIGEVRYDYIDKESSVDIQLVSVESCQATAHTGDDAYGRVVDGQLVLRCPLYDAVLVSGPPGKQGVHVRLPAAPGCTTGALIFDGPLEKAVADISAGGGAAGANKTTIRRSLQPPASHDLSAAAKLYDIGIHFAALNARDHNDHSPILVRGLLLGLCADGSTYQRIGFLECKVDKTDFRGFKGGRHKRTICIR